MGTHHFADLGHLVFGVQVLELVLAGAFWVLDQRGRLSATGDAAQRSGGARQVRAADRARRSAQRPGLPHGPTRSTNRRLIQVR